ETGGLVVVTGDPDGRAPDTDGWPAVVVLDGELGRVRDAVAFADVVASGPALDAIIERFHANPMASTSLALLLRGSEQRPIGDALAAESAVYSTLQSGREFARWRESHPWRPKKAQQRPSVIVERDRDELIVTLDRPEARNALDTRMRDELWEAFLV